MVELEDLEVIWKEIKIFYPFIQEFGYKNKHCYKGSLLRHITIERVIVKVRNFFEAILPFNIYFGFKGIFYTPFNLLFGLNCNYRIADIIKYLIYWIL